MKESTKRALRTAVQTISTLSLALLLLALFAGDVIEALKDVLPEGVYLWIVGAIATLSATSAALSKFMSRPEVNKLLDKAGLGLGDDG